MSESAATRSNPYIGPRAFEERERSRFFGRDRELSKLLNLLIARRLVLLHAPSGAGKTSLIQAALIPRLRAEGFRVHRPLRLNTEMPPEVLSLAPNRYLLSTLMVLDEELPADQRSTPADLAPFSLSRYLDLQRAGSTADEVLIFDQFEELLSVDPTDRTTKEAFLVELGIALEDTRRWALFVVREDYLGPLRPFLIPLPTRLDTLFRLDLLDPTQARRAVQGPAQAEGVTFDDAAATKLINDLRRTIVQRPDGTNETVLGQEIEPVQLQVVCYQLWERLFVSRSSEAALIEARISLTDVESSGDVDTALRVYYAAQVAAAAVVGEVGERQIRTWIEKQLITEGGLRSQVIREPEATRRLTNTIILRLVDAHLLRADERRGSIWYELAHDRLITPVHQDNAVWFAANLSDLQRHAELWVREDRRDGLLAQHEELRAHEVWAKAHAAELTDDEREFLERSRQEQDTREREARRVEQIRRQNVRIRWLSIVIALVALVAVGFAVFALNQQHEAQVQAANAEVQKQNAQIQEQKAQTQARIALVRQLSAEGVQERERSPQTALLLAVEAAQRAKQDNVTGPAEAALRTVLASSGGQPLSGHYGAVTMSAFSPDGRWLATISSDSTVRLWPIAATVGEPIVLRDHTAAVNVLAFSPDNRWLVTGDEDANVLLWSLAAPQRPVAVRHDHRIGIRALAFSPDSRWFASGAFDGSINLYQVAAPQQPATALSGHSRAIRTLAFSPDSTTLASGSEDNKIQLWNVMTQQLVATLEGHTGAITHLAFSPDGKLLASASDDRTVRLWTLTPTPTLLITLSGHADAVVDIAFSPDGKLLASASWDQTALFWQLEKPDAPPTILRGHTDHLTDLDFSPNGQWLVTTSTDGTARVWTVAEPGAAPLVLRGHQGAVLGVSFHPDSQRLATSGADMTARLWDVNSPVVSPIELGRHTYVTQVVFNPSGSLLATVGYDNLVQLWNMQPTVSPAATLDRHTAQVLDLAFSPDGRWLATTGQDSTVLLWQPDVPKRAPIPLPMVERPVLALAFSPDSKQLAGADNHGTVWIWSVVAPTQAPLILQGGAGSTNDLAFSPDGRWLATASGDNAVRLWALDNTSRTPRWADQHSNPVVSLAFSPDSTWLVSGSGDKAARLWRVDTDSPDGDHVDLPGQNGAVLVVGFSPDGRRIVTGSLDGSALLWDVQDLAKPLARMEGHAIKVAAAAFSPDSAWLVTGDGEGTLRIWDLANLATPRVVFPVHDNEITTIAFSPDSRWFATGSSDEKARLWTFQLSDLIVQACLTAGRNLSLEEWQPHIDQSVASYQSTCAQHPPDRSVFLVMLRRGDGEQAFERYSKAQTLAPQHESPAAWLARLGADIITEPGQLDHALAAYQRAVKADPVLPLVDATTLNAYCRYAAPENVRIVGSACELAADRAPHNGNYAFNRGRARVMLGNYDGAIKDFEAFLAWAPGHPGAAEKMDLVNGWLADLRAGRNPIGSAPPTL